jgi:molybdopterin converting factor small subunit
MVEALCHRCGREWDYTGRSDYYGTCPNCNTSVKLERERASEAEGEALPDPSDRETVEIEAGGEAREVGVIEAVEAMDGAVEELYELGEARGETMGQLRQDIEAEGDDVDDLRDGLKELAGYFAELIEAAGGEVEFEEIEETGPTVPEALENVDMEEFEA